MTPTGVQKCAIQRLTRLYALFLLRGKYLLTPTAHVAFSSLTRACQCLLSHSHELHPHSHELVGAFILTRPSLLVDFCLSVFRLL